MDKRDGRGGRRKGSGRPKTKLIPNKGFAERVLARIGELGIQDNALGAIKTEEDYALRLLYCGDLRIEKEVFVDCINRKHGKPIQTTEDKIVFDPNAPLRVVIEHIGRTPIPASAQTKPPV